MDGGEIMILGKLALTFGILLGFPIWDLWRMERRRRAEGRPRSTWPAPPVQTSAPVKGRPECSSGAADDTGVD